MKLTIDINSECNHDCTFCYAAYYAGRRTLDDFIRHVNDCPAATEVQIGGGEPLLHADLPAMAQYAVRVGKDVHIATNGTIVPPALLTFPEHDRARTNIQVSLHAATPDLHQRIVGRDTFDRVVRNLDTFRAYFPTTLSAAIYQDNLVAVPGLIALARDHQVPIRINPVIAAGKGKHVTQLTADQLEDLTSLLLVEVMGGGVDSALIHPNNCIALARDYAIPQVDRKSTRLNSSH